MKWLRPNARSSRAKERGAVLLTTLLVMALMASLSVAIFDELRVAVKRASSINAHSQADWYLRGAEDFAQSHLQTTLETIEPELLGAALRSPDPIIFPVEGGMISLRLRDGGTCLSINAINQTQVRQQFTRLLEALGWDPRSAERLTAVTRDWIDNDTQISQGGGAEDFTYLGRISAHRTANTALSSVLDMRALESMDEEKFQRLRPYICTRAGEASPALHINNLDLEHAPLLASLIATDNNTALARAIIEGRPAGGYADQAQLQASAVLENVEGGDISFDLISYAIEYVWVEAEIIIGEAALYGAFEFSIDEGQITRSFKRNGNETFRPNLFPSEASF